MNRKLSAPLRKKVAREAALLLYTLREKEFKQAKERAAKSLGLRILPSNLEVAEELDLIADEIEGDKRRERLVRMRKEALEIMGLLKEFNPKLIGSVWRGTVNKNSDIDIVVFSRNKDLVIETLIRGELKITAIEVTPAAKDGSGETTHIYSELPSGDQVEIVVRSLEDIAREERCDIYGDLKRGLSIDDLKEVLERDPLKRFIPKRKGVGNR